MTNPTMHPVTSSQIKSVGYDPESKELYIEFLNGTVYSYSNVPEKVYEEMITPTVSVGKYFFANIKGVFGYAKRPLCVVDGKLRQI